MFGLSSKKASCPFCYREIDFNKVAFRCNGHGLPGRLKCEQQPDERRVVEFNDNRPVRPIVTSGQNNTAVLGKEKVQCSGCGSETGIRVCPSCHSTLPYGMNAKSPMFGLVGVRNSGKTVYLSVLHTELSRRIASAFGGSIDTPGGLHGYAQTLAENKKDMEGNAAKLPAQTSARGDSTRAEPVIYEWSQRNKRGETDNTVFSFFDSAGEDLVSVDAVESQHYLKSVNGIILLLDPFGFDANVAKAKQKLNANGGSAGINMEDLTSPQAVISNLTEVIRRSHGVKQGKKIKTPIAIVLAKIDAFYDDLPPGSPIMQQNQYKGAFDEQDSLNVHENVRALLHSWNATNLINLLENYFETYRFFAVSALGAEPDYANSSVNKMGVIPMRVGDPLLWLMAERKMIDTVPAK